MPDRRRRMLVLGGALAAMPLGRPDTTTRAPRVGMLLAAWAEAAESRLFVHEFREGLRELGRAEGRGYFLTVRSYGRENARIASAAQRLRAARCDVLVSETSAGARALESGAGGTPVVVAAAVDRPVGQVTGVMAFDKRMDGELVELAHDLVPQATRVGFVCDPAGTRDMPPEVTPIELSTPAGLPRFGERLAALQADALVVAADARFFAMREAIVRKALAAGLPTFGPAAEFAELGALASYGCDVSANFRAVARYVDRLLRGAKPDDLPVEPPQRFELVVNLKTARALHLDLPGEALLRADRIIE